MYKQSRRKKAVILIEILLIIFFSVNYIKERIKNQPIRRQIKTLTLELDKLQNENKTLKQRLLYLQNPENKKKEMRDKLNLGEPGEKVIILPEGY